MRSRHCVTQNTDTGPKPGYFPQKGVAMKIKTRGNEDRPKQLAAGFQRKSLEREDTISCFAWPQSGSPGPWANQSVFLNLCFPHWKMEMPFLLCRAYQKAKMRQYLGKDVKWGKGLNHETHKPTTGTSFQPECELGHSKTRFSHASCYGS